MNNVITVIFYAFQLCILISIHMHYVEQYMVSRAMYNERNEGVCIKL